MKILILPIVAALVGCATMRPPLPDAMYTPFARMWAGLATCQAQGMLSTQTAAAGQNLLIRHHGNYQIDDARMHSLVLQYSGVAQSTQDCNSAALAIARNQQASTAIQQPTVAPVPAITIPKPVWCNTVGTTTMCN